MCLRAPLARLRCLVRVRARMARVAWRAYRLRHHFVVGAAPRTLRAMRMVSRPRGWIGRDVAFRRWQRGGGHTCLTFCQNGHYTPCHQAVTGQLRRIVAAKPVVPTYRRCPHLYTWRFSRGIFPLRLRRGVGVTLYVAYGIALFGTGGHACVCTY